MVSVEEALHIVSSQSVALKKKRVSLNECLGNYLAEEVNSPFDLPGFDNSAMDGYALCGDHLRYQIVGEVAAGDTSESALKDREAVRIFTGAKVPEGTTSVVMQEKTSIEQDAVVLQEPSPAGKNIRRRGGELAKGQKVFEAGHKITAPSLGMLSSLGMSEVPVFKKPKVGLIVTGDELVNPWQPLAEGQIYESNSAAIAGALEAHGFQCAESTRVKDDFDSTKKTIADFLEKYDVVLISGGISVGEYDFVKGALEGNGVEEQFYKVAQKPGKPLFFGRRDKTFFFALPGNPASSLTCFYIYVVPLLQKMAGSRKGGLQRVLLPLAEKYFMKSDRPSFLKAKIESNQVEILDGQSSSMIHALSTGNALVYLTEAGSYESGDLVETILI